MYHISRERDFVAELWDAGLELLLFRKRPPTDALSDMPMIRNTMEAVLGKRAGLA